MILRLYNSIAQVISGFDIDSCCVAFDGKRFYAMPRFVRALKCKYNLTDPERQSSTYAQRLYKYMLRGFNIVFPGIFKTGITCSFQDNFKNYTGIAKIISYYRSNRYRSLLVRTQSPYSDYEYTPFTLNVKGVYKTLRKAILDDFKTRYLDQYGLKSLDPSVDNDGYIRNDIYVPEDLKDQYLELRKFEFEVRTGVWLLLAEKQISYSLSNRITLPIKVAHKLEYILDSVKNPNSGTEMSGTFISSLPAKLQFKTVNVGTQKTGSFNPTNEKWYDNLYLN